MVPTPFQGEQARGDFSELLKTGLQSLLRSQESPQPEGYSENKSKSWQIINSISGVKLIARPTSSPHTRTSVSVWSSICLDAGRAAELGGPLSWEDTLTEQMLGPGWTEVQFVQVVNGIHDVKLSVFVNAVGASVLGRGIHCPWNTTAVLHAGQAGGLRENHSRREAGRAQT